MNTQRKTLPHDLLNLVVVPENLVPWDPGFFEPAPEWDSNTRVRCHDRLWS